MKRFWKILGITVGAIVGAVLIVVVAIDAAKNRR